MSIDQATLATAAARWGLNPLRIELIAQRENHTYRVFDHHGIAFALRLHRPGYNSISEIESELDWMAFLAESGMQVPRPLVSENGSHLVVIDKHLFSVNQWLSGEVMGRAGRPLQLENSDAVFFRLGETTARLHNLTDQWQPPDGFVRRAWDREGLLGESPVWDRFWENPLLDSPSRKILQAARTKADRLLRQYHDQLDYGLIHADLIRENVMIDGDTIRIIDFDDCGFGYRLFELATILLKLKNEAHYHTYQRALLAGYRKHRDMDSGELELFLGLRSFTYVGWAITRLKEGDVARRCQNFIDEALVYAQLILAR